jgi:3-methylfumaryl-CoA hydratase
MAQAARATGWNGGQYFEYRLTAPLFDHQGMVVRAVRDADATVTAVRDLYGRQTASGALLNAG